MLETQPLTDHVSVTVLWMGSITMEAPAVELYYSVSSQQYPAHSRADMNREKAARENLPFCRTTALRKVVVFENRVYSADYSGSVLQLMHCANSNTSQDVISTGGAVCVSSGGES